MTKAYKVEQFDNVMKQRDRLDLMLHDVMNGNVVYGAWVNEPDSKGKYRVGIADRGFPLTMVTFRHPGQSDSIQVFDLEPYEQELIGLRSRSESWEPVLRAFQSAKEACREKQAA